jgi:pilus assembly protein CpaF
MSTPGSLALITPFIKPLQQLLLDPTVTEVMVNPGLRVFVERGGILTREYVDGLDAHLLREAIRHIARFCQDEVSDTQPILDARLEDGSRVAALLTPVSIGGDTLTIRKFGRRYSLQELEQTGMLTDDDSRWIICTLLERQNVLISGGTGTGKTTLLNAVVDSLDDTDRFVVIEETSELAIHKPNVVRLEARRAQPTLPAVTIADLVRAALRHRPDRIILGEVRGAEAFDLLQALNTGHGGSLSTIHANSAAHALTRFAHCVLMANSGLPYAAVQEAVRDAIGLVVHLERTQDGQRRVAGLLDVQAPASQQPTTWEAFHAQFASKVTP